MGWILGYKGMYWWPCGVINHAEQHIQSTECLGYGFIVIVWDSAFDFLRWVGGLAKKGFLDTYGMDIQFHTSLSVALWGYRPCWTTYPKMEGWVSRHHDEQWPGGDFHCCGMKDCMKWRAREFDMARFRRGMGVFVQNKLWLQCILALKQVGKRFGECIWYMDNVMDDILWIFGWKKRVRWVWKKKRAIRPVTQSILRLCPSRVINWTWCTWFV